MNPHYKEPVIIFGLVAPLLLIVLVFALGFHFRGKFEKTYEARLRKYEDYKSVEAQREALEKKIRTQEPHMNRWMRLFEKPTATAVNGFFSEYQKRQDGKKFQQTKFRRTSSSGGIGGASSQPSIQLQLAFRGTFRALQNAFLELETRMPQLQLDSIKLSIAQPNQDTLNADLIYTAWQKK
ncbi:MAG: hypothetical protein VCA35_05960 [Roseibacillus sp.]